VLVAISQIDIVYISVVFTWHPQNAKKHPYTMAALKQA
jgi:hypothetical protein